MNSKYYYLLLLAFVGQFTFAQPPSDYIARYDFEDAGLRTGRFNRVSSEGSLTALSPTETGITDRFGRSDQAMLLNGTEFAGKGIENPNINAAYSISFWLRGDSTAPTGGASIVDLIDMTSQSVRVSFSKVPNGEYVLTILEDGFTSGIPLHSEALAIDDLQWHHVVIVVDVESSPNDEIRVYVDNNEVIGYYNKLGRNKDRSKIFANDGQFIIGNGGNFQDAIDDVQLFNRSITPSEIDQIFTATPFTSTIFVKRNATGDDNGTSWNDAFTTIKSALSAAEADAEIWVAQGTYRLNTTDRNATFYTPHQVDGIEIYGGFNGTETMLSQRDVLNNATILTGDNSNNDTAILDNRDGSRSDNAIHVMTIQGDRVIIDGLTIEGGHADGTTTSTANGAGIYKLDFVSQFYLRNSIVQNNYAKTSSAGLRAWFIEDNSELEISGCKFDSNLASFGSGVYTLGLANPVPANNPVNLNFNMFNNIFTNNTAANTTNNSGISGSAVWVRGFVNGSTTNFNFINNTVYGNKDNGTSGSRFTDSPIGLSQTNSSTLNTIYSNNISFNNTTTNTRNASGTEPSLDVAPILLSATDPGNVTASNSIITLIPGSVARNNVLIADPKLVDPDNGDFNLDTNSPAINFGDNSKLPNGFTEDFYGNMRVQGNTIDAGAVESSATASVNIAEINNLRIYPNPAKNVLHVDGNFAFAKAEIFNLQGQSIINTSEKDINTTFLRSGIYLLKVSDQNGNVMSRQFVKE